MSCLSAVASVCLCMMSAHLNALIMAFVHLDARTRERTPIQAITIMN